MKNALQFYKALLKQTRQLPKDSQSYYQTYVKENFQAFRDETDSVRINELIEQGKRSAKWVLEKVLGVTLMKFDFKIYLYFFKTYFYIFGASVSCDWLKVDSCYN